MLFHRIIQKILASLLLFKKGTCNFKSTYFIVNFIFHHRLSFMSNVFIIFLDPIFVPKIVKEALNHREWSNVMLDGIHSLEDNRTWNLVVLPKKKKSVRCKWIFTVKVNLDGSVARRKVRLKAKRYAHTYGVDYSDTFSLIAKLTFVRLFISLAVCKN